MANQGVPEYGRRLVPQVLDELATTDPQRVYAAIPRTADVKDGYRDVTVAELARCVDYTAKWIEDKFGRSDDFETITYIGLSDLRGVVTLLAAIKTGYKLLIPSPRNPPNVNAHLMDQTGSNKLLYAAELAPLIKPLEGLVSLVACDSVPTIQVMLDSSPAPYPYTKTFEEARADPIAVLHSSGSTGLPKPITITHGSVAAHDGDLVLPAPAGREKQDTSLFTLDGDNRRLYLVLPFFHLGGFIFFTDYAILGNLTLVLGPAHVAPDAALLQEVARQQTLRAIMVVPAIVEQLLHDPNGEELLKSLSFVTCAGAPLPGPVGDRVARIVRLCNFIGSTETFPLPELRKAAEDWQYHEFNPYLKHEMQLYDDNLGTYELIISADDACRDQSPVCHNLPGVNPFYTRDLFTQHPTKPNLYKYYGRRDDILVLANGEKVNPIPLEQHAQGDPRLKGVLLVGDGRTQSALIVEPREDLEEEDGRLEFLQTLWARVEEANSLVPGPGRVRRGMLLCATPKKPFARTGKGTVVRKLTENAYKTEIDRLYASQDERLVKVTLKPSTKTVYEAASVVTFLRQIFAVSFPQAVNMGEEEDFFAHGLDSIQTLEITANLKRSLEGLTSSSVSWISPRLIFRCSTLARLSAVLGAFLNDNTLPSSGDFEKVQVKAVEDLVTRYVNSLPKAPARSTDTSVTTAAVVGSTGYVGSHLVARLLKNSAISRIYCLDRDIEACTRLKAALGKIDGQLDTSKLVFLKIEVGTRRLGLSDEQYQRVVQDVDVIVYNAWKLDFGLAIHSFEPFLHTLRELVDITLDSQRSSHIVFVSSMSSVEALALRGSTIPEAAVEDPSAALNTGYGQSKWAAERILDAAAQQSGVPVSVVRLGQVGGSKLGEEGIWADQPWISALIHTSKSLGLFPSPVAPVDWVSVDDVALILEAVMFRPVVQSGSTLLPMFYNVVSEPQSWDVLVDAVQKLDPASVLKVVPLPDWVAKLREVTNPTAADVAKLPALRLLDFYQDLGSGHGPAQIENAHAAAVSGLELGPVQADLLGFWLKSWNL